MKTNLNTNTLIELKKVSQSPWYDNIDRRLIKNGKLKSLFDNGILGVTSNPTIFEKAVSASNEYDENIRKLSREGKTALEIYDILTAEDVSVAADLLKDTYENTARLDGYVSIEVLPQISRDAEKTEKSAREIFRKIGKPNIMIKVPGTPQAPRAITALTKDGVNVNVTLLFSVKQYEVCADAYINGLKERLKEGKNLSNIFSAASVFISRLDTMVDEMLLEKNEDLKGKVAVANAKMIYQKFKEIFESAEFKKLEKNGANAQRVLWASTSTKNPLYNDLKYVESLIGPRTINTMPPQTVDAFLDHGKAKEALEKNLDKEKACLKKLAAIGIDLESVCRKLQDDGVDAFQKSFDKLIHSIEKKADS